MRTLQAMILAVILAVASLIHVQAHSWLVKPVARENYSQSDVDGSMGCPSDRQGESTSFAAGETIDVRYWRNNHIGGFIRWAIVPLGEESKESFDKNVFYYTCRESGPTCVPKGENKRFAGDSSGANTISCGDTITLPDWLPSGDYVLQWTWFGVGSSYGNKGWAEPQFRSCADIKLTSDGSGNEPSCPTFVGGDRVTKLEDKSADQCFYMNKPEILTEQFKGSNDGYEQYYHFGVPTQVQECSGGSAPAPQTTSEPNDEDETDEGETGEEEGNDSDNGGSPQPAPTPTTTPSCRALRRRS